jgi:hypothetical protein
VLRSILNSLRGYYRKKPRYSVAKRTEYKGRIYHSKREAEYARDIDLLQDAGEIKSWTPQVLVTLSAKGEKICRYVLDFKVEHKSGDMSRS